MRKGRGKTGVSVRINSISDAKVILRNHNTSETYLREIIVKYVPADTRESVDRMNYTRLRYFGHVIQGVAKKMISEENKRKDLEQLSLNF